MNAIIRYVLTEENANKPGENMLSRWKQINIKKISPRAGIIFLIVLVLSFTLVSITIKNKSDLEKMTMEQLIMEKSVKINEVISKLLYKTQALSALVIQNNGDIEDFDRVASTMVDDPAILNVLLAPDGVVSHVYPLEGNESLVGFDLFGDSDGNKEAILARETGQLVFGGPFELMQGGQALVGRLPVLIKDEDGNKNFWGVVSVTLKYPQALDGAALSILEKQGFTYEIWRVNPDNNERQIIAGGEAEDHENMRFIEKHIPILNADWYFRIAPVREWYQYLDNWILIFSSIFISFLIAFIMQNNYELNYVKTELEGMVNTDALTGLINRKGLFGKLERLINANQEFQLYYLDLNHFKDINDTFGHNAGDYVLTEFSHRIGKHVDENYIFARISGDEFIVVYLENPLLEEHIASFWNSVSNEFNQEISLTNKDSIKLTFSKGVAVYPKDGKRIDELISCADKMMYKEKGKRR